MKLKIQTLAINDIKLLLMGVKSKFENTILRPKVKDKLL